MTSGANTSAIRLLELDGEPAWVGLQESVDPSLSNEPWAAMLEQLRALGCATALIELHYLDRDYSAEYSAFYSRLYQRHSRHCWRIHFFQGTIAQDSAGDLDALVGRLRELDQAKEYLGFAVIRPVADAPIGRAVIASPRAPEHHANRSLVGATYEAHLFGIPLRVRGVPFTQQDTRLSACAQASIWMAGRHFHTKHQGPWFSTAAITEAASQPTDMTLAMSLPAGSNGLNPNNILRALRAMERHPYAFAAKNTETGLYWPPTLSPQTILSRYVGSGIPVIAGLKPWRPDQSAGHAVVVVGDVLKPLDPPVLTVSTPEASVLTPYFLVHDDQRGPCLRMGVERGLPDSQTPYNVRDHLQFVIVPLPDKVFMPGEVAEVIAWDVLRAYLADWPTLKTAYASDIKASAAFGDEIAAAAAANQVVAKTYLTLGWRHKDRIVAESGASHRLRERMAMCDLPKMVWVTEFARLSDVNTLDSSARRIFGHCVFDATSTGNTHPPLFLHLPGFLSLRRQTASDFYPESTDEIVTIDDDGLYRGRSKPERRTS